jgi:PKD repeat protein
LSPVPVVAGQKVWLAWLTELAVGLRHSTAALGRIDSRQGWSGGMPVNFGTGTSTSAVYSLYANVVVHGGTNQPPVASFTNTPSGASYGINFNGTGSSDPDGTIVSWAWNFGDGTTGNGQTVSHTYTNGNTRTVTLTVTDNSGATGTLSQNVTPVVVNAPPVAQFTTTPTGVYGIDFNATGSSDPDGTIVGWAWNFGDGTTGNGQTVSHTYANGNTRTVTLTVTDNGGATATATQQVTPLDMTGGQTVQVGYTTVFPGTSTGPSRRAEQITIPNAGTMMSLSIYHMGGSGGLLLAVYSDNANTPGTRLGVTQAVTVNSTQGWQEVALASPVPVVTGQKVWLAWLTELAVGLRHSTAALGRIDSRQGWSGGMPVNFGTGTSTSAVYSLYANVVVSGGNVRESDMAFSGNEFKEDDPNQISVYPNPFNHYVNLELQVIEENTLIQIALIDLNGKTIGIPVKDRFRSGHHTIGLDQLEMGVIQNGVYILKVELNEKVFNRRIIRQ